jgi:hypothetical protein
MKTDDFCTVDMTEQNKKPAETQKQRGFVANAAATASNTAHGIAGTAGGILGGVVNAVGQTAGSVTKGVGDAATNLGESIATTSESASENIYKVAGAHQHCKTEGNEQVTAL